MQASSETPLYMNRCGEQHADRSVLRLMLVVFPIYGDKESFDTMCRRPDCALAMLDPISFREMLDSLLVGLSFTPEDKVDIRPRI